MHSKLFEPDLVSLFERILREFLPATKAETKPTTATVFMALLRRKIRDFAGEWRAEEERAYRMLRAELVPDIRDHVIEQNNWWQLIRVAFDLAEELPAGLSRGCL